MSDPAHDPVSQPLQDFSFKNSQYERPNQSFVYVPLPQSDEGIASGEVLYERPVDDGAAVLVKPTLRKQRGMFTLAMTALTAGFLMIGLNSPWSNEFIAPGPLSSPHAQILGDMGSDRCAACHQQADGNFSQWAMSVMGGASANLSADHQHTPLTQSQLCMKCHEKNFAVDLALNPHNIPAEKMSALTTKVPSSAFSIKSGLGLNHGSQIACNACHREHHGDVSLSQLTDQQCQSCHQQTFHSFETDHPEFTKWPLQRRQNIAFDHSTHFQKHFPANKTEFTCNQCHTADLTGNVQQTAPFEQSCGSCHAQQIADSGDRGWALFALPMIDMKAVEGSGLSVGNWPRSATGDFDGDLPPMMQLLLAADDELRPVLQEIGSDFSFGDIDPDDRDDVANGVKLIWGIKRLLRDLANGGRDALADRLASATEKSVSQETVDAILAGLDERVFDATARRWLPDLERELDRRQSVSGEALGKNSADVINRDDVSLWQPNILARLAPQELLADNPLSGRPLNQESASVGEGLESSNQEVEFDPRNAPIVSSPKKTFTPGPDSELLVDNPLQSGGGGSFEIPSASAASSQGTSVQSKATGKASGMKLPDEIAIASAAAKVSFQPGWYRSDVQFVIGYRPAEHADPLVKAWSDFVADNADADTALATRGLFEALTSATAAGNCRSCHTVDRLENDAFAFRWGGTTRDASAREFTKFSHRPHLTLPQLQDCQHCHQLDTTKSLTGAFDGFDGLVGVSNFAVVTKADCAACHRSGRTDSGCMQCHNYHVAHQ